MKNWIKAAVLAGSAIAVPMFACGGETPPAKAPDPPTSASATDTAPAASSAAPVASSATPAASSAAPAPAPPKGTVKKFAWAANSGTVDKVGEKDGNLKPDGVKDQVFDLEYEGTVKAIFVMTTDKEGTLTSEFDADTIVGDATIPAEIAGILNQGKTTYALGVYESDKLLNGKDGAIAAPLADGPHKLALYVSSKSFPAKTPVKVFVLNGDGGLVKGPMLAPK